jgi:hypothetical protein
MSEGSEESTPVSISKSGDREGGPKYCRNCGAPLDTNRNCINCGYNSNEPMTSRSVPEEQSYPAPHYANKQRREKNPKVKAATIAVLIIILVGIYAAVFTNLGSMGDYLSDNYSGEPSINVYIYDDTPWAGDRVTITWTCLGRNQIGDYVDIFYTILGTPNNQPQSIALQTENDGSYTWVVPTTLDFGTRISISVSSTDSQVIGEAYLTIAESFINECAYNFNWTLRSSFFNGNGLTYPNNPNNYFAIVKLKVINSGSIPVSTSPVDWKFVVDNIEYIWSINSFSSTINSQSVTVNRGGTAETEIVYEVPPTATWGSLVWDGLSSGRYPNYVYRDVSIDMSYPDIDAPVAYSDAHMRGIQGSSANVVVSWSDVPGAGLYEVEVSSTPDFNTVSDTHVTAGNQITVSAALQGFSVEAKSYVRVRAWGGWGWDYGDWSNTITWELYLGGYNDYLPYGY